MAEVPGIYYTRTEEKKDNAIYNFKVEYKQWDLELAMQYIKNKWLNHNTAEQKWVSLLK